MQAFFNQLIPKGEPVEELDECAACGEEKPIDGGEEVVTYTHRVEGRAVAQDSEFVCGDCISIAEDAQAERAMEARYWRGEEDFRRRWG